MTTKLLSIPYHLLEEPDICTIETTLSPLPVCFTERYTTEEVMRIEPSGGVFIGDTLIPNDNSGNALIGETLRKWATAWQ